MFDEWMQGAAMAVAVASAVTAVVPTPPRPGDGDGWIKRFWWLIYQMIELAALVNRQVKARPNAAAAIVAAAEKGDLSTVIERAKLLVK